MSLFSTHIAEQVVEVEQKLGWGFYLSPIHELLPLVASMVWIVAYAALHKKLRHLRSAQSISLQSLTALLISEWLQGAILVYMVTYRYGSLSLTMLFCQMLNCALVSITFRLVVKHFIASYDAQSDGFGRHHLLPWLSGDERQVDSPSNSSPSRNSTPPAPPSFWSNLTTVIGPHWAVLYVMAAVVAIPIEILRRHGTLPIIFSCLESFSDTVTALALIPQLYMIYQSKPRVVPDLLARFILGMLVARAIVLLYW